MRLLFVAAAVLLSTAVPRSTAWQTSARLKQRRWLYDNNQLSPVGWLAAKQAASSFLPPKHSYAPKPLTNLCQYRDDDTDGHRRRTAPSRERRRRKSRLPPATRQTIEFNRHLREVASSRRVPDSARRAHDMLQSLLRDVDAGVERNVVPNSVTFGIVINAWSRSRDRNAADMAEKVLAQLTSRYALTGDAGCKPTAYAFCAAVRARCHAASRAGDSASKADRLLRLLEGLRVRHDDSDLTPDRVTYTQVINSYARSRRMEDAGLCAEALLRRMEDMYDRYGKGGDATEVAATLKPDRVVYSSVMKSWANSGHPDAPARAEALLRTMEERYQRMGDEGMKPDAISYTCVIKAWSSAASAAIAADGGSREETKAEAIAERAEALLRSMEERYARTGDSDLMPDAILYGTVINLWAGAAGGGGGRKAADRAEALLRDMVKLYEAGNEEMKPDTVVYTMIIKAWAGSGEKAGGAERAETILKSLEERYDATGDVDVKPDSIAYGSVIDAWAESGVRGSAERAERLFEAMEKKYSDSADRHFDIAPNIINLTAVIKAWRNCEGQDGETVAKKVEGLLTSAVEKYEAGNNAMKPNDITFSHASKAVARASDADGALARVEALRERVVARESQCQG